jgi:hypothetical protein
MQIDPSDKLATRPSSPSAGLVAQSRALKEASLDVMRA